MRFGAGSPQSDPSYVPIGDRQVIRLREERTLAGHKISDYVPFYLGPRSPMLYVIQHGYNGVTRVDPEQIDYFPTKTDWRRPSEYSYIEQGLHVLYHLNGSYIKGMGGMDARPFDYIWLLDDTEAEAWRYIDESGVASLCTAHQGQAGVVHGG